MAYPNGPRLGNALNRKHYEDRRSNSTTSSARSQMSDQESIASFDPENEAIASTQPFNSPTVPRNAQRAFYQANDAKNSNGIFGENRGSDYETTDMSIEIGRGKARHNRIVEDSRNDDSVDLSSVFVGDYSVTCSPPDRPKQRVFNVKPNENAHGLRQAAQIRFASMASQKENLDPAPRQSIPLRLSETASKIKRKTLGEINTRAAEMYDGSILNNERPINDAPATKTTRFSRSKRDSSIQSAGIGASMAAYTAESNQSFLLPDLPNLSQLMSGKQRGTPLPKSRFAMHPALSQTPREPSHKVLGNLPIPDDEKAIIISLDLLQRKVIELEASASEFQQIIEELKTSNVVLKAERKELKDENSQLRQENQQLRAERGSLRESSRSEKVSAVHQPHKQRQASALSRVNDKVSQILSSRQDEDLFSLMPTESTRLRPTANSSRKSDEAGQLRQTSKKSAGAREDDESNSRRAKKVVIEENATAKTDRKSSQRISGTHNVTYIGDPPISNFLFDLRQVMEAERQETNGRKTTNDKQNSTVTQPVLPRKSSMKDISHRISPEDIAETTRANSRTGKTNANEGVSQDITDQISRSLSDAARRQSDPTATAASNTSRRRRASSGYDENMTSAFIIPDITIAQPINSHETTGLKHTTLTDAAHHLIQGVNPHDATNCLICSRLTTQSKTQPHGTSKDKQEEKKTIVVPIPSLVSSTPVQPTADNPDPTIRPSQNPSIALAIVLKELTDQHEHIKLALRAKQDQYAAADPRLSRRKRERLGREIEALLRKCEATAGMIYRLCDVLEGQKESGIGSVDGNGEKDWTHEEIEITVQELRDVVGVYGCVEETMGEGSEDGVEQGE